MTDRENVLTVQEIEPGYTDKVEEWFAADSEDEEELKESLREEGVLVESSFVHKTESADYLIFYIEAEDFDHAVEEFNSTESEDIKKFQSLFDEILVGGMEQYHADRADPLFDIVVDEDARRQ